VGQILRLRDEGDEEEQTHRVAAAAAAEGESHFLAAAAAEPHREEAAPSLSRVPAEERNAHWGAEEVESPTCCQFFPRCQDE
jgi:hypothetical protein